MPINKMPSPRDMFSSIDFYFDKVGITSSQDLSFDSAGFSVSVSYAKATYKLTVCRVEALHYRYTIECMGNSVTGDVNSKVEWELGHAEKLVITNAILQFQSMPKQMSASEKLSDFSQILSELLERIESIAKETESLMKETRAKIQR